ncbi:hypothetical protein MKX01_014701 [Papaver californicum]|nr:hypothetical protein MKX01_014701 [Papaver californicum]
MDQENENNKNQPEKGTENPTNHLLRSDNSMEMRSDSKVIACVIRSKYLMRFKSVCTQWKSLIKTDNYLIDSQYRYHSRQKTLLFISSPPPPECDEPETVGGGGAIDFTMLGPTEVRKLELDRSNFGIPKQTVAVLVCITAGREAFLIYNPSTGERTPWIKTTTVNGKIGPRTKEHKVLCILSKKKKGVARGLSVYIPSMPYTEEGKVFCMQKCEDGKESKLFDHADDAEEVGPDEEQVCETVPPYSLVSKVCYVGDLGQYNEESKSVYVRGKIYWRFRYTRKGEVMMVFDVKTEKFKVISIPEYTVELLEVDGHIAVLKSTKDCPIALWILDQDDGSDKWSYEQVRTPCKWNGNLDLCIQALSGSNFIILKRQMSETTYLYDRVKKGYNFYTVNERHGLNYHPGELREILTLVDSITPVCTKRSNIS